MKKLAFLSMDDLQDFFVYDELLIAPFADKGYQVDTVSWHLSGFDFSSYEAVIVRSPWDYQQYEAEFVACLTRINEQTRLMNSLPLMLWNLNKRYLKDLAAQQVPVLPTLWLDGFEQATVEKTFAEFACDEIVIKPCVSANADDTFRLTAEQLADQAPQLAACFNQRECMVQPFVTSVTERGEVSLFYFAGQLSHAILKRPKDGDFRVQEEHGGSLQAITPQAAMLNNAEAALAAMPDGYLYARVDLLWFDAQWRIIELELIEPSLYFNLDEQSPERFVDAYLRYFNALD
ncbi:ATP-grasp domain-containing protein [Alteromonas lipolytica]|uniref:Prokaryotic glutathione synthetase ATP-binding domain-containing protein n=1 Tax=Alteromonas lipolytica TaxID=1856405 RepID=A0A1E8FBZ9_9ALTE|nr:hypothetical protein [Alteromonas lipolytica]OFI33452.1 hypothetical protein BFC17_04115 [Alteromonas lipolytica]GGF59562.1 ATP-grasp domain protein [Alteromonas lipolytica]